MLMVKKNGASQIVNLVIKEGRVEVVQSCCVRVEEYWSSLYNKHQITCFNHEDICYKDTIILVAQSN